MASKPGVGAVVADANVILSAAIGKAALRVFTEFNLDVHVSEYNYAEVREYLDSLAARYRIPLEVAETQLRLLSLTRHDLKEYEAALNRVPSALLSRDPDDAHAVALARTLGLPIWSNDADLRLGGVPVLTTAQLLKRLENRRP